MPFETPWRLKFCISCFFFLFLSENVTAGWVCTNCSRPGIFAHCCGCFVGQSTLKWAPVTSGSVPSSVWCTFHEAHAVLILGLMSFAQLDQRLQKGMDYTLMLSPDPSVVPNAKVTTSRLVHSPLLWLALWINSAQSTVLCGFLDNSLSILLGWRGGLNGWRESKGTNFQVNKIK